MRAFTAAAAALAAAGAALLGAGPARAADTRLSVGEIVDVAVASAGQRFSFRADLVANQDYVIAAGTFVDITASVSLFAPNGRRVTRCEIFDSVSDGCEFLSRAAGSYRLVVEVAALQGEPGVFELGVLNDCAAGPATRCTIRPGRRQTGTFAYYRGDDDEDVDRRKATLRAGQKYQVVASAGVEPPRCEVRDPSGAVLATCQEFVAPGPGCGLDGDANCSVARFTTRRAGVHSIVTESGSVDAPNSYAIRLDQGWPAPRP